MSRLGMDRGEAETSEPGVPSRPQRMWLSEISITQPVFIAMVVLATLVMGAIAYSRMPIDLYPDVSFPLVVVRTVYPGASPEEVERSVTKPIEDAVAPLNGVDRVRSTSADSVSTVIVEFKMDRDARQVTEDVRSRLNLVRNTLPAEAKDPLVDRFDPSAVPIMSLALGDRSGKLTPEQLRSAADDALRPLLERVDGVAAVRVTGGQVREVHVDLQLNRLHALGVPPQQVAAALAAENTNVPVGRLSEEQREQLLRTAGEFQSVADIAAVPIASARGARVRLQDLATVAEGFAAVRALSRLDGQDSVVLSVQKQSGTNTVRVADEVRRELNRFGSEHPQLDVVVAFDFSTFTRDSVRDLQNALILGAVMASLVVLFFFRNLRNTLVTIAGLPVVVLGTFAAMQWLGVGLNMISMMALSLSIGLLVDDAIVVRENIFRHMQSGEEPREASRRGTAEIALAVLAVSSTVVAVFLPTALTGGMVGEFMRDFGITVSTAVIISLIEAFTLAPMLSAYAFKRLELRREGNGEAGRGPLHRFDLALSAGYGGLLRFALRHRLWVLGAGVAIFVASLSVLPLMSMTFDRPIDQGQFLVTLELPAGSALAVTDRAARAVEQVLQARPDVVERLFTTVGSADGSPETAAVAVQLKARGRTAAMVEALRPEMERAVGKDVKLVTDLQWSAEAVTGSSAVGALQGQPIQISVQGANLADLDRASQLLVERIRQVPGIVDADRSVRPGKPGLDLVVDRVRAADLGISSAQVGSTMRYLINGQRATGLRAGDKTLDVVVRLQEGDRTNLSDILRLPVATATGIQVPLSTVASPRPVSLPTQIDRQNRQRQIVVGAGVLGRDQGAATADVQAVVEEMKPSLPPGVTLAYAGQIEATSEALAELGLALALSVLFVYMILASQFGNLVHPLTIMLALPFSIVGAVLAIFLSGKGMDTMVLIGIILLMGLVAKNSILLVDFAIRRRREGLDARQAMLEAGPIRLRPILMTTLAMIFGMLPIALGLGAGSEFRQPMGIAVVGGLVASTLLTLLVVPVAYSALEDVGGFVRRLRRGRRVPVAAAPVEIAGT